MKTTKSSRRKTPRSLKRTNAIAKAIGSKIFSSIHWRVQWKRLSTEPLGPGDMWASTDPNTPERQGQPDFNLQMQAIHPQFYGKPPGTNIGNGWHWRPVSLVECL